MSWAIPRRMMSIKGRIVPYRYLDFTLQPLIFHKIDMTPWERLPNETGNKGIIPHFGGIPPPHPLPGIPNKQDIRKTVSKGDIWGPFYVPKGEVSGGN